MNRLADIEGRIASIRELLNIVGAMRSLAGMRVQEAQQALPGVQRYTESMAAAIRSALLLMPAATAQKPNASGSEALVLCAGEHGFVGGFNERLLEAAETALGASDSLFILGSRGAVLATERELEVAWSRPIATRPAGVSRLVNELATELYSHIVRGEFSRVEVMFTRYTRGVEPNIERVQVLPLNISRLAAREPRQAPLHNLDAERLFEKLTGEYVFATLTEAAVESIASENAARFAAMDSAHRNVSQKLDELREQARQARQTEITTELLDLITGAEAQGHGGRPSESRGSPSDFIYKRRRAREQDDGVTSESGHD
jgi:F-type H+-transporting ATPase subunit gamma